MNVAIFRSQPRAMKLFFNALMRQYLAFRKMQINRASENAMDVQKGVLLELLKEASHTRYGQKYNFSDISSISDFQNKVPIVEYEDLFPHIKDMMAGQKSVLWPGIIRRYAKSSGTTTGRSKYIPVPDDFMKKNHLKGSWDAFALLYDKRPDVKVFASKNLGVGGSLEVPEGFPDAIAGDISALMVDDMPAIVRNFYVPSEDAALMEDWEKKLDLVAEECVKENIVLFGGVPTWNLVLFRKMLDLTGAKNMIEIWPNASAYFHGGVGFEPYREEFQTLFPKPDFLYQEAYNASEGMMAQQDRVDQSGMLLLVDHKIFYEFIPFHDFGSDSIKAITLEEVEVGEFYVIVISTAAGLWRYVVGDLIKFISIEPFRLEVVGRTKQYINAFGEELMIHNANHALGIACREHDAKAQEFCAAPQYPSDEKLAMHRWAIEFTRAPKNEMAFVKTLDQCLRNVNSDYDAKRTSDLFLQCLELNIVPEGTFDKWYKTRGKVNGQTKFPSLSNDDQYLKGILKMAGQLRKEN